MREEREGAEERDTDKQNVKQRDRQSKRERVC